MIKTSTEKDVQFEIQLSGCAIIKDDKLLLLKKYKNSYYELPGGKVDLEEDIIDAAIREVKEETGAEGKIIKALIPVTYWFVLEKEKVRKTVYYFLMEYVGGDITKHDHEMETVVWLLKDKVEKRLTYKSDKIVWKEAKNLI